MCGKRGALAPRFSVPKTCHFFQLFFGPTAHALCNSATISPTAFRASSSRSGGKLIAPTRACPPPPYRSQIAAIFTNSDGCFFVQGLVPTETFVRKDDLLNPTLYVASGCK